MTLTELTVLQLFKDEYERLESGTNSFIGYIGNVNRADNNTDSSMDYVWNIDRRLTLTNF